MVYASRMGPHIFVPHRKRKRRRLFKVCGVHFVLKLGPSNGTINGGIVNSVLTDTGASGSGTLATLYFQILSPCVETSVLLSNITLYEPNKSDDKIGTLPTPIIPVSDSVSGFVSLILPGVQMQMLARVKRFLRGQQLPWMLQISFFRRKPTYTWSFVDGTLKHLKERL
jgi:hypothetical protein